MDDPLPANLVEKWSEFLKTHPAPNWKGTTIDRHVDPTTSPMDVFDDGILFPLQRKRELQGMLRIAIQIGTSAAMEIGADKGGGLFQWCNLPGMRKIVAIEIRGTPYSELFRAHFPDIEFLFIPGPSLDPDSIEAVVQFLGPDQFDCIFIDGDKGTFMEDFNTYRPMVRRGGYAFLHDIHAGELCGAAPPVEVFERLATNKNFQTHAIIDITEGTEAKEAEKRGEPCKSAHDGWLRYWGTSSCGVGCVRL